MKNKKKSKPSYIEEMEKLSPELRKIYLYGEWDLHPKQKEMLDNPENDGIFYGGAKASSTNQL